MPDTIVLGIDWGMPEREPMRVAIVNRTNGVLMAVVHHSSTDFESSIKAVARMIDEHQPFIVLAALAGIDYIPISALEAQGYPIHPYVITKRSKEHALQELKAGIESGQFRIIEHSPDYKIAVALAWHAARMGGPFTRMKFL